jgi:hypothetical protein
MWLLYWKAGMDESNHQAAGAVIMIRPVSFGYNEQTAWSNAFQERPEDAATLNDIVNNEFEVLANKLMREKVEVIILDDTETPTKPDAIFCNNWISFHHDGTVIFYPMMAANRRSERRRDVIEKLKEKGFKINRLLDYSKFEATDKFLESTGSMVIDYVNRIIYACHSPRTDLDVLKVVAGQLNMDFEIFSAVDRHGRRIYHTNVLMTIGNRFAIICLEAIKDTEEKSRIIAKLSETGHEIIDISYDQLYAFAGNMLQLRRKDSSILVVMSDSAYQSLEENQLQAIKKYSDILSVSIPTIEKFGGGSVRCMLADVHLPKQ